MRPLPRQQPVFIDGAALEGWVQALEGKGNGVDPAAGVCVEAALGALRRGSSLGEVVRQAIEQLERLLIARVLEATEGNKLAAARLLKIDYKTLYRKLDRYVN